MRHPCLLAALALFAQASTGVFEIELWPGEGRPRFQAVADELIIRALPSQSAPVVRRLVVSKGQDIAFDETRYRTLAPGQLQALSPSGVSGRVLGPTRLLTADECYMGKFPSGAIATQKGDLIQYLQYRAEGTCFVRIGNQVVDADPCPAQERESFRVITQPRTEWWIRVVVDRVPVGWVTVSDSTVKVTGRSG